MKVIGLKILDDFVNKHSDARGQIGAWISDVTEATWDNPGQIIARYAKASFLSGNRVIFNIKGNRYRLEVKVNYENKIVLVKQIGTHAEYSKWQL